MHRGIKICLLIPALLNFTAWIDPFKDLVHEGNRFYENGKYDESMEKYKDSEKYLPHKNSKYGVAFNRGDALYKKGKYGEAIDSYKYSLGSSDPAIQKKAFFNMGNASLKLGKYREAMESYSNALKIDPNYVNAKKNIEYMLKNMQDRNNQQNNKDISQKDNKGNSGKNEEKKKENENSDKSNGSSSGKDGQKSKMTREQIENILKSMRNKPVRRQKEREDGRRTLEKYW